MKDNNTQQSDLDRLLKTSDFNEVRIYLKRNKYLNNTKIANSFWQSELPVLWFNDLIKEPLFENLLFFYFKRSTKPNETFLKQFFDSKSKSILIKIIKLSEAFKHDLHWKSFSIFQNDNQLKIFYKELQYVRSYRSYWEDKSIKHIAFIQSMDYEDILIQMVSCYEQFKRYSNKTIDNRSLIISYESHLIKILNLLLNVRNEPSKNAEVIIGNKYDENEFKLITKQELPIIRPVESFINNNLIPKEIISSLKKRFREAVEYFFSKDVNDYQINTYLSGFAEFCYIDNLNAGIKTNTKFTEYRKTLEKGKYDETYFTNKVVDSKEKLNEIKSLSSTWEKQFKLGITSSIEYLNFLKIPKSIHNSRNNSKIEFEKALLFIKSFSLFLMPQGRMVINGKMSFKRELPKEFKELFHSDYIVSYNENELIRKCKTYFKWPTEEVRSIVDFFTTDLNNNKDKIDIKKRPLLKIGTQYVWLSSFFRDRRWEIILHQKIVAENLLNHNDQSTNSENYISTIFKEGNFNAISSYRYREHNKNGEIDVLAFKNGILFICELKSTYTQEDILKTSIYETQKFKYKASEQLDLAKDYVDNNFDEIKGIKELNIDCSKEDLKIETLIISNIYEADHLNFNKRHLKVSLFELLVILKNDLYQMLVPKYTKALFDLGLDLSVDNILNKHNKNTILKEDCNLWENEKDCSPEDIISAILENKVWKHQDANKNFFLEETELSTYDKKYKYLD